MTGIFEYKKICKCCGNAFVSQKRTTKYCGEICAKRDYKAKQKAEKQQANGDEIKERNRQKLLSQEYLSLTNAAALLGISRPTIYKIIANDELKTIRISERVVRVKKSDLEQLQSKTLAPIKHSVSETNKTVEEYISVEDALQQFKISLTWFYKKIRGKNITPVMIRGKAHYPMYPLRKIFSKKEYPDVVEWLTAKEIMLLCGVSLQYVYDFTSTHKLPKKREGKEVLISKYHWDKEQGNDPTEKKMYYTVPEITEKYGIDRDRIYEFTARHKIPKIKHGRFVMISRQHFDELMNNRKK